MSDTTPAFTLYGTTRTEPATRLLTAGKLEAHLAGGNLRSISYDGVEVLRAISYLVRDRDWGTCDPALFDLSVNEDHQGFSVTYRTRCSGPDDATLDISASIEGRADGILIFRSKAGSATGFETNRCGFCILHPIVGLAGTPVVVEHVGGDLEETRLPDLIEPWQPFKDMRAITTQVLPGVTAECRMEGDIFEMEDQRNWSDASYKTYVRPLALPWPYRIKPGEAVEQAIRLQMTDKRLPAITVLSSEKRSDPVILMPGAIVGIMPAIGIVVTPEEAGATLAAIDMLADLGVQELIFHFDPLAGHGPAALASFAAIAARHRGTTTLEIAVPCLRPLMEEMAGIAAQLRDCGFRPAAVFVSPAVDRQSTPPGSIWPDCPPLDDVYAAARAAFPDKRIGGGMLGYFTELNRKRVPPGTLDFISHCTNPIVHAADDLSVMQTLEALPFITRSVRAIYGNKPYRIGPSTIAMRQNPYGSRTMDNPENGLIAMARTDPRHNASFGAAFALGYAARVIDAGLECLTLSALTGPFGLIAGENEPMARGRLRPLASVVRTLASLAGLSFTEVRSLDPSKVLAIATSRAMHIVNLTPQEQSVRIEGFDVGNQHPAQHSLPPFGIRSFSLQ